MNVGEMKEWLNQFPDDTIVEIVKHSSGHGYYDQGGNATTYKFDPHLSEWGHCLLGHCEFTEWRGTRTLLLGGYNC